MYLFPCGAELLRAAFVFVPRRCGYNVVAIYKTLQVKGTPQNTLASTFASAWISEYTQLMASRLPSQEFAVIGLGRFGSNLALKLTALGHTVLGIDRDAAIVQALADDLSQTVALDATDEDALATVSISDFDTVVVAIADDFESNLMITVLLKEIGVKHVICKASTERQRAILERVGANQVILPELEAGVQLAYRLVSPFVLDRLELEPGMSVSEIRAPQSVVGKTLGELKLRERFGISVLLIKGQRLVAAPSARERIDNQDVLVLIGPDDAIAQMEQA